MNHIEFLVEEESAEVLLQGLLPKLLPPQKTFTIHPFQGKRDLLSQLPARLKAYSHWLPNDWRIVVLVDEDRQDCLKLKQELDDAANLAGLSTKTQRHLGSAGFQVLNRISIEEIEAWYFGDIPALIKTFPGVPATLGQKAKFRDPDTITGGTWEALERVLQKAGYYPAGVPKIELARLMATAMSPSANTSRSFQVFRSGIASL